MNTLQTIISRTLMLLTFAAYGCCTIPKEAFQERKYAAQRASNEYIGIIHCHSSFSHDSAGTKEEIITAAKKTGLDFIIMTEHAAPIEQGLKTQKEGLRGIIDDVLFIHGFELSVEGGSILAINPGAYVAQDVKNAKQIVDEIHQQNGFAFLGHIEHFTLNDEEIDGIELYNAHAILQENTTSVVLSMLNSYIACPKKLRFHPLIKLLDDNKQKWDALLRQGKKVSAIAGNDVHVKWYYPWGYEDFFALVRTHVFADALDTNNILSSLKKGRCYFSFDSLAQSTGFEYCISGAGQKAVMGDVINLNDDLTISTTLPISARVKILCDGELFCETEASELHMRINKKGAYRLEAYIKDIPWIISNPIFVE